MRKSILSAVVIAATFSQTAFAQQSICSSSSNQEYKDIANAVNQLGQALNSVGCSGADMSGMIKDHASLKNSAQQLSTFWKDPSAAAADPKTFSDGLTGAIQNINSISSTLATATSGKSECGKKIMTSGRVIMAVSDVVTSIAPLAVLAGTMKAALPVAVPYVLAVTTLASVFKVVANATDTGALQMSQADHRQLVLKSVCDYSLIYSRLRYLMLMQSGDIGGLQREISQLNKKGQLVEQILQKNPGLKPVYVEYKAKTRELDKASEELRSARIHLGEVRSTFNSYGDDVEGKCFFGVAKARSNDEHGNLFSIADKASSVLKRFPVKGPAETVIAAAVMRQENNERRVREMLVPDRKQAEIGACASLTDSWIKSSDAVLMAAEQVVKKSRENFISSLNRQPAFKEWSQKASAIESERLLLARVLELAKGKSDDSSAIDSAELSQRERELRGVLFGARGGIFKWFKDGSSLVGSWIRHTTGLYSSTVKEFTKGFSALNREVSAPYRPIVSERPVIVTKADLERMKLNYDLNRLTLKTSPKGSTGWKNACHRLDDLYLNWARAADYYKATRFFCQSISEMIETDVEPYIIETCVGSLEVGRSQKVSGIARMAKMAAPNMRRLAIVNAKRAELQCASTQ